MTLAFVISLALFACDTTTVTTVTTADTENFYDIYTNDDLLAIDMNKSYTLQADLDLAGIEWMPLGTYAAPYAGIFDGNGHSIQNLTITEKNDFAGLFACLSGEVFDLTLTDVSIDYQTDYQTYVGGLAGYISGNIENVEVTGSISVLNSGSDTYAGMLAGMLATKISESVYASEFVHQNISDVHVSGLIDINTNNVLYAGGLTGYVFNVQIDDCYSNVDMTLVNENYRLYAGGLIGYQYGGILYDYADDVDEIEIPISGSVASGSITATANGTTGYVGGFVGFAQSGVYNDSLAFTNITATGEDLALSTFAGGTWLDSMENLLGAGSIIVEASQTMTMNISTLSGSVVDEVTFTDCYYYVSTSETIASPQGMPVSVADLENPSWFQGWLDWNENVCSFSDLAAMHS